MNTLLIAGVLWILVVPPVEMVDGEPRLRQPQRMAEWKVSEYLESGPACRAYRDKKYREYWEAFNRVAKHNKALSRRYFAASSQFSLGKCMPAQTLKDWRFANFHAIPRPGEWRCIIHIANAVPSDSQASCQSVQFPAPEASPPSPLKPLATR